MEERRCLIPAPESAEREGEFSHPLNPKSLLRATPLSRLAGLERAVVSLARLPSGHESFIYHNQYSEEEWLYIISGRGVAEIDGERHEVGPGDFMGFPTTPSPSVAHNLENPFDEDLVYLMGGEHHSVEVADFPKINKRLIRSETKVEVCDLDSTETFGDPQR